MQSNRRCAAAIKPLDGSCQPRKLGCCCTGSGSAAHRRRRARRHRLLHEPRPHRRILHQPVQHAQRGDSHAHEAAGGALLALIKGLQRGGRAAVTKCKTRSGRHPALATSRYHKRPNIQTPDMPVEQPAAAQQAAHRTCFSSRSRCGTSSQRALSALLTSRAWMSSRRCRQGRRAGGQAGQAGRQEGR